jgi:hypothetical protein
MRFVTLKIMWLVIRNEEGDYVISSTSTAQCSTNKKASAKVELYVLLLQRTKTAAVVLFPGTVCNSAHHPTCFHLAVR